MYDITQYLKIIIFTINTIIIHTIIPITHQIIYYVYSIVRYYPNLCKLIKE